MSQVSEKSTSFYFIIRFLYQDPELGSVCTWVAIYHFQRIAGVRARVSLRRLLHLQNMGIICSQAKCLWWMWFIALPVTYTEFKFGDLHLSLKLGRFMGLSTLQSPLTSSQWEVYLVRRILRQLLCQCYAKLISHPKQMVRFLLPWEHKYSNGLFD